MGVKYVKEFTFPASGGFHVQRYAKGGHVTKVPAKAAASAKGMPSKAKPNAKTRGAPKMESKPKMGKGQGYERGGRVPGREMDRLPTKRPPGMGKDMAPARRFKGAYEGYADGGPAPLPPELYEKYSRPVDERPPPLPVISEEYDRPLPMPEEERLDMLPPPPPPEFYEPGPDPNSLIAKEDENFYRDFFAQMDAELNTRRNAPAMPTKADRMTQRREAMGDRGETRMRPRTMNIPNVATMRPRTMNIPSAATTRQVRNSNAMVSPSRAMNNQNEISDLQRLLESTGIIDPRSMPIFKKGGEVRGEKISKVMREYKEGKLRSGSKKGPKVTNPKQAMAIALSEARSKKANGGNIKKAVHKHEKAMHPGKPMTKLQRGGVPTYGRKAMYGSEEC